MGGRTVAFWLDEPSVQMQEGKKEGGTKRPIYISTMNYCLREARFLIYSPYKISLIRIARLRKVDILFDNS